MNLNINVNSGIQRAGTPTTGNQGNKQGHFLQLGQLTKAGHGNIDIKEQSARRTKSLTAQVMRNAEKMEAVFLDRIDNSRSNIAANKQKMDVNFTAYKDSYNAKNKLAEEFEVTPEEMKLLDKAYNAEKDESGKLTLTEEEQEALKELRSRPGVSDYEEQANVLNEEMDTYRKDINDSIKAIKKENYILSTVKQEYLKVHIMADANKEIDKIKTEEAKSLIFSAYAEAKENIDEKLEEAKEEQAEQEKEEAEKEKIEAKREEREAKQEVLIEKAQEDTEDVSTKVQDAEAAMAETEAKVNEINAKLKQLEELLNGNTVDTFA